MTRSNDFKQQPERGDDRPINWLAIALHSPIGLLIVAILLAGLVSCMGQAHSLGGELVPAQLPIHLQEQSSQEELNNAGQRPRAAADLEALRADPAIRNFQGLSEYSWDFNDPHGVPGFGPMPSPCGPLPIAAHIP